jgi:hypothetical protein
MQCNAKGKVLPIMKQKEHEVFARLAVSLGTTIIPASSRADMATVQRLFSNS